MPYIHTHSTMNPTVEEINEGANAGTPAQGSKAENGQLSWPKICSQHEFVLSSHLGMLQSARELANFDDNMLRTISSMLDKTNKLMSQFRVVKKQVDGANEATGSHEQSQSTSKVNDADSTTASRSNPLMRKKRGRAGDTRENGPESRPQEDRSQKRKRVETSISGNDEDVRNATPDATPGSVETEDISEEVQRRLEIKEEQRKRRYAKPEKRKRDRDSFASNDGTSSLEMSTRPKKKRMI